MFSIVAELLRDAASPTLSFEFFPPHTPEEQLHFEATVAKLDRFHPALLSVIYGTSDSVRDRTVAATAALRDTRHTTVVGRLTCVSQSTDDLLRTLDTSVDARVSDTLVIRGDIPGEPQQPQKGRPDELGDTTELVQLIKAHGDFYVGVAAFSNVHQLDDDPEPDARIVTEKATVGADYAITRLFFESHHYVELVNRVYERDSQIPIIPGVAPLTAITQTERFILLVDRPLPKDFVAALEAARNPAKVCSIGLSRAVNLCWELLAAGAPGLQFSAQNRWKVTSEVLDAIGWEDRIS